jgi:hypothetical protein
VLSATWQNEGIAQRSGTMPPVALMRDYL